MNKDWLKRELQAGKSLEQIGREIGRDGSTVAYWAKRFGLCSQGADRFAPRGAPDRAELERLAREGAALDRSIATVRHAGSVAGRSSAHRAEAAGPPTPATAPPLALLSCVRRGIAEFRLDGRGFYRCKRCASEQVSQWRRRAKRTLVLEAGGGCRLCGYDRCQAALQFHHLDPADKSFALSREGVTRGLAEARAEAAKCVLLCANCHAEVEAGYRSLEEVMPAVPA